MKRCDHNQLKDHGKPGFPIRLLQPGSGLQPMQSNQQSDQQSDRSSNQPGKKLRSPITVVFSSLILLGGVSANWGLGKLQAQWVPILTQEFSQALDRPIQLGAVERVSWSSIRFGASQVPATATDPDTITAEAIEVNFDPIRALQQQQLQLTITLVRPTAYIVQDGAGDWLNLELVFDQDAPIELEQLRWRDATVTLVPQVMTLDAEVEPDDPPWDISQRLTQLTWQHLNGGLRLLDQDDRLQFDLKAQLAGPDRSDQGWIDVKGDLQLASGSTQLAIDLKNLDLPSLTPLIPTDLRVEAGKLNAQVDLTIPPTQLPIISGQAQLTGGALQAKGEPNPFTGVEAQIQLQNQQIHLQRGELNFGQIPFQLAGTIDLQHGFDLSAQVPYVDAAPFMQTLELEVPFPVAGALTSDNLRLTGSLTQPVLSGTAIAAKPLKFDRLEIAEVQGQFSLSLSDDYLQIQQILAKPVIGGQITTQAEVWLEEDSAQVNVAVNLPADRLTELYGSDDRKIQFSKDEVVDQSEDKLVNQIVNQVVNQTGELDTFQLGQFQSTAQITVDHDQPKVIAQWQLDQGSYPAEGKIQLDRDRLTLQDTIVQIGSGTVTAAAQLQQGKWQADLTAAQVDLSQLGLGRSFLADQATSDPSLQAVPPSSPLLQAQLHLQGDLQSPLQPVNWLDRLQAVGSARIALGVGAVTAKLSVAEGEWRSQIVGNQIEIDQLPLLLSFPSPLPFPSRQAGHLAGSIDLWGRVNNLSLATTQATAALTWVGLLGLEQPIQAEFAWLGDRLQIHQAGIAQAAISGSVTPQWEHQTPVGIAAMDLAVNIQDYDLTTIPGLDLPIDLQGWLSAQGKITGTLDQPHLVSTAQLDRFRIANFQFEPLQGQIEFEAQQIGLDLRGSQDRLALWFNPRQATTFAIQQDQAQVEGQWYDDQISAQIRRLPLAKFNLMPITSIGSISLGSVQGWLDSQLQIDLKQPNEPIATAIVEIQQPGFTHLSPRQFSPSSPSFSDQSLSTNLQGKLHYAAGLLTLSQGNLDWGQNRLQFSGQLDRATQQWQGQIAIEQGELHELLVGLPIAAWMQTLPPPASPVIQEIESASQGRFDLESLDLAALLTQLQGQISAQAHLRSAPTGIQAQLSLSGTHWRSAHYGIDQIAAQFELEGESLQIPTIEAAGFRWGTNSHQFLDAKLRLQGQATTEMIAGQAELTGISLSQMQQAFQLPIDLTGQIQAVAAIGGSPSQPQLKGELHLDGVKVREIAIEPAKIGFSYIDRQFHLEHWQSLPLIQVVTAEERVDP